MGDIVSFSWPHVLSFLLGAAVGVVLRTAGRPRAENTNRLVNALMDHAAFWLYPGRRVWIGALILGLPWLLYGANLAFGAGAGFDVAQAYGGVIAGAALLFALGWAARRFLPLDVQRAAHRARSRSLERGFQGEIARLRGQLECVERGLEATRQSMVGGQGQAGD